jgi:hypothetical protein
MDPMEIARRPAPQTEQPPLPAWLRAEYSRSEPVEAAPRREGVVTFFGGPQRPGGEEHLLKAAFLAAKRRPELSFRVALRDRPAESLAARLRHLGLDRCAIVQEPPTATSLPALAAGSDLLVIETLPTDFRRKDVEALARRVPIILNKQDGNQWNNGAQQLPGAILLLDFWDARRMADAILYQLETGKKTRQRRQRPAPLS